jgi:hypothetical protein
MFHVLGTQGRSSDLVRRRHHGGDVGSGEARRARHFGRRPGSECRHARATCLLRARRDERFGHGGRDQRDFVRPQVAILEACAERALGEFWRALAICHTVLTERPDEEDLNVLEYKAESVPVATSASAMGGEINVTLSGRK